MRCLRCTLTQVYTFPHHARRGRAVVRQHGGRSLEADLPVALESMQFLYGLAGITSSAASAVGPVEFLNNSAVLQ
jgi:hypothetical protein